LIVTLRARDGRDYETWADDAAVTVEDRAKLDSYEALGEIEVRALEEKEGDALIELPNETIASGRRIWVKAASIVG